MRTPPPNHLAPDALDSDELVDGSKGMPLAVGGDFGGLGGPDSRQQAEHLGRRRIQVDDAVHRFGRARRAGTGEQHHDGDDRNEETHASFSARGARRLPISRRANGRA